MAQLPDVESLQLLVLVGEHGSLTSAAAVAGISQPSASKRMSAFERRLGLTLGLGLPHGEERLRPRLRVAFKR